MDDAEILENVMMSFAFADSTEKLQKAVSNFLVPVLGMLKTKKSSPQTTKKVFETLTHISKRIKSDSDILLPVRALIDQYRSVSASPLQKNFTLVYIQLGFVRCPTEERKEFLTLLLENLETRSESAQDIILSLFISSICSLSFPRATDESSPNFLKYFTEKETKEVLLEFFLDILSSNMECYSTSKETPPKMSRGMTLRSLKRLNSISAPKNLQELNEQKLAVLRILDDHVSKGEALRHFIVSSSDMYTTVSQKGENMFRVSIKHVDMEDEVMIRSLFSFYEGTKDSSFPRSAPPMGVKLKITSIFQKSKIAANLFPSTLKIVFDLASSPSSNTTSQQLSVDLSRWILMSSEEKQIRVMGPAILSGLFKMLRAVQFSKDSALVSLKSAAYGTMGLICKRLPLLFSEHYELVEELFNHVVGDVDLSEQISISEALCAIANTLHGRISNTIKERLYVTLASCQASSSEIVRYIGLYFATHVLPFSDLHGRYACCISIIEVKSATRDLATRGLHPFILKEDAELLPSDSATFPDFFELVHHIEEKYQIQRATKRTPEGSLPFDFRIYSQLLTFLQETMKHHLERNNLKMETDLFLTYILLIEHAFDASKLLDLHKMAANSLTQLFASIPGTAQLFVEKLDYLWPFLFKGKPDTRECMAKALGMILEYVSPDALSDLFASTMKSIQEPNVSFEIIHGSLSTLGMIGNRCVAKNIVFATPIVPDILTCLRGYIKSKKQLLVSAACSSIGAMARYGPLPLSIEDSLLPEFLDQLKGNNNQTKESILHSLGDICLGEKKHANTILESIYALSRCKHEEVLFTAGETLSVIGSGWNSSVAMAKLLPHEKRSEAQCTYFEHPMEDILRKVIKSYVLSSHPEDQVAGSIWLLSLTQFTGNHPQIQKNILSIQRSFTYMLASPNEVIQEVGSRGLVLVYEHGTKESQKELVTSLVGTLSSGGKTQVKHSGHSELFPEGLLGKAPGDNSKLSTYKELSSLASELGKPELMYKFMNLASHHQMWSSRKGAAFAATTLASSEAKAQLQEHLPTLVPKLYRCSYDPNSRIAQAMNDVLKALLAEKRSLDPYWDGIVAELLDGMGSRQWRVRQASCTALADGLSGRSFQQVSDHLEKIYYMLFRVIDDIKESVAKEALSCSKTLTRLSIQLCDPIYTSEKEAAPALAISLQFLLEKGLVSEAKTVQVYALDSIHKLCKASQHLIAPHVPHLCQVLLENLSFFEPAEFNYIQQKTEEYGITKDQLETARLAFSNSMPMNDTLDICAAHITTSNVREVSSKLFSLITSGIGLPTQAGTAKFLASITRLHPTLMKKYAGRLMLKLVSRLGNPSASLRKLYASTIAYLSSLCTNKVFGELLQKLKTFYFSESTTGSDVKIFRNVVAICILELAARAPRKLSEFHIDCIPLVFFGTCDTSAEETRKLFDSAWVEIGGHSSDRIFMDEIILLIELAFTSSAWIMKRQSFLVLKKLADRLSSALSRYTVRLLGGLFKQVAERRIWTGKEDVFPAISSCCAACKDTIEADDIEIDGVALTPQYMIETILLESKRNSLSSKEYQRRALTAVAQLLETFCPPLDMFAFLFDDLQHLIEDITNETTDSHSFLSLQKDPTKRAEEEKEASLSNARKKLVQAECFKMLGAAWPIQFKTQEKFLPDVLALFVNELRLANWNSKIKILAAMELFVGRICVSKDEEDKCLLSEDVTSQMLQALGTCINDPKYKIVRESALKTLRSIVLRLLDTSHGGKHCSVISLLLKEREVDLSCSLQVSEIKDHMNKL